MQHSLMIHVDKQLTSPSTNTKYPPEQIEFVIFYPERKSIRIPVKNYHESETDQTFYIDPVELYSQLKKAIEPC